MRHEAADYGWQTTAGSHSNEYVAPRVLALLADLKVKRVLDLGSGIGKLCAAMSEAGYEVVGAEPDAQGVAISKARYPAIPFYAFGVQDAPEKLTAEQPRFDAVVSTEVIEHLYSPQLLPAAVKALLKDDGYLIVTTPYHGYLKNLAIAIFDKWDSHHASLRHGGHIKFWSRETLTALLENNGFRVISFSGVGRVPYLWKSMVVVAMPQKAASMHPNGTVP